VTAITRHPNGQKEPFDTSHLEGAWRPGPDYGCSQQ
jgi:hypothetical protein